MLVNADFSRRAMVAPHQYQWIASPQAGVERVMLDRVGGEKARATSIVRYAPHSSFPRHEHPGGEEILVLSGTFSDERGHYPAGWYLRSPPGSGHRPFSEEGATIFVKLWQMPASEQDSVRIDTRDGSRWTRHDGREHCLLFSGHGEQVSLERLAPGVSVFGDAVEGAEILVLEGSLHEVGQHHERGTWIRLPRGRYADVLAGDAGATLYLKTGHLGQASEGAAAC